MEVSDSNSGIVEFFKTHPFQSGALIASSTIFLCSFIGFLREYLILKEFGINVVTYAELNDFLVAGLKDPYVLAILPVIAVFSIYVFITLRKRSYFTLPSKVTMGSIALYPIIIAFAYIPFFSVSAEIDDIRDLSRPLNIKLRGGEEIDKVSLISTTEKFVFIWSSLTKSASILTISNIISINYVPRINENVQQVNTTDAKARG